MLTSFEDALDPIMGSIESEQVGYVVVVAPSEPED
jgi:hypothetical protein